MTTSQATVYYKTEAGLEEMQSRQAGLNPRVRQLLILIDGKRNVFELQKLLASVELEEFVALLELKGLIAPDPQMQAAEPVRNSAGLGEMLRQSMTSTPAKGETHELGVDIAVDVAFAEPPGGENRVLRDRQNLAALLAETVGPMSDEMCSRILQAARPTELGELLVASLTVVELMSGRKSADRFVEKLKNMGWNY